jgi:hypothetical protein
MPKEWYSWVPCAGQPGSTSRRSAFPPRRLGIPRWGTESAFLEWAGAGQRSRPSRRNLGQVLAAVELVTEDDTVGCDLILTRGWVMGATAGLENG